MSTVSSATELQTWLRSRRSVRRFADQSVPADLLLRVLETAVRAPNAHNRQPWRFVHLKSEGSRDKLAAAMGPSFLEALRKEDVSEEEAEAQVDRSRVRITEAPEAILLCMDTKVLEKHRDEARSQGEYLMGVQSVALAGGQLLLAAHAERLGGVWLCAPLFVPSKIGAALKLPAGWVAQGLLLLGYPAAEGAQRARKDLDEVLVER